jgi:putative ABC transport system permease protein
MRWFWFAVKNVLRNGRRSAITVLIAAVGTSAILVGGGFALFTYESLREMAARESGHLVLAHRDHFARSEDAPLQHGLQGWVALRTKLLADERVRAVLPRLELSGLVSNGDRSEVFLGTGVDAGGEFAVRGPFLTVTRGSTLSPRPEPGDLPEVMLGSELARNLSAVPGGTLTLLATTTAGALNAQDVRVKGVFSLGVPEIDRRAVLVHLATGQALLRTDKVSTLSVYLHETEDTDAVKVTMARLFPDNALQTWMDQAFYYLAVRGLYDRIFGLLGAILVVMVLFAVSNTLGMAVVERTREIGTLRALGSMPSEIVRNFALEGLVIGTTGALGGIVLAVAASVVFAVTGARMPPPPGRTVGYPLHVEISFTLLAATAAAVVLVSVVAAWLVSRRAARRPIVEALAHV